LNEPISLEYEIINQSEELIEGILAIDESEDFYIGGELKSQVLLMPKETYVFRYNLIPLQIGRLVFPKVTLLDKEKNIALIKGYTRKCLVTK
jgi:hypothetical protein